MSARYLVLLEWQDSEDGGREVVGGPESDLFSDPSQAVEAALGAFDYERLGHDWTRVDVYGVAEGTDWESVEGDGEILHLEAEYETEHY